MLTVSRVIIINRHAKESKDRVLHLSGALIWFWALTSRWNTGVRFASRRTWVTISGLAPGSVFIANEPDVYRTTVRAAKIAVLGFTFCVSNGAFTISFYVIFFSLIYEFPKRISYSCSPPC